MDKISGYFSTVPTPDFLTSERNKKHVQKEFKAQFTAGEEYMPICLLEHEKFGTKIIASVLWHSGNKEWMKILARKEVRRTIP